METEHPKNSEYSQVDFAEKLWQITSRDLTVDNIDDYAEAAFNDLVNLTREVEAAYSQQPYYEVTVPTLERKVLICDGYGNATFVFDTSKLPDEVQAALVDSSKQQLGELIDLEPGCGMVLRCSKQFVPRLVGALRDEIDQPESQTGEGISYLDPDRNTELKTQAQVARELGVHVRTVARTVSVIDPKEFGSVITKGSRRYIKRFYTDKQMAMVKDVLENRGLLRQIPEGYVPVEDIIAANNISVATAYKAIKQLVLDGAMEQPDKYPRDGRAHKRPAIYCSPEQQQLIQRYIEDMGLNYPNMPDDYTTVPKFCSSLGVSKQSVLKAASTLGVELKKYRTRGHSRRLAISLSPEQQAAIRGYFESEGFFRTAPEGYATFGQLHKKLGTDHKTARKVISRLLDEGKLGEVKKYRKRHQVLVFYSPDQQAMIRQALGK